MTERPLDWWCYLPGEYEPEQIAAKLNLDEIPFDGFMITTHRVADAVECMIDRTLDLDANEYVVNNTAECDWILAESRDSESSLTTSEPSTGSSSVSIG